MPLRSMTGFAQVKGELISQPEASASPKATEPSSAQGNGRAVFALSNYQRMRYAFSAKANFARGNEKPA